MSRNQPGEEELAEVSQAEELQVQRARWWRRALSFSSKLFRCGQSSGVCVRLHVCMQG